MGIVVDENRLPLAYPVIETTPGSGKTFHGPAHLIGGNAVEPGQRHGCHTVLYIDPHGHTQVDVGDNPDQYIANFRKGATAVFKYFDISELFLIAYFAGDEKLMEASKDMKFSGRPLKKEDFINYSDGIFSLIRSYRSTIGKIDRSCPLYSYLKVRCKETPIYNNKDVTKGMKIHLSTLCISAAKFGEPLSDYYLKVLHYRDTGELPFAIVDVDDE